jgi:UDP-galactopyranose mutase
VPRVDPTEDRVAAQRRSIDELIAREGIRDYVLWYYTPMALAFTDHLEAETVVFDCMDELSGFAGAPAELGELERRLFERAGLVLTGGYSLYEAKRDRHPNVHPIPSSVDPSHFRKARSWSAEPADQASIGHPRLGYFGVIDERVDLGLLAAVAETMPDWQIVMVGPITKIDPGSLPRRPNIHYLGPKAYEELPGYLAGWDVALLPFARNDATRFISPTKTPEYLAAGRPVVSTSIRDVVRTYGEAGLVRIADRPDEFVAAVRASLAGHGVGWLDRVDRFLAGQSWDRTWSRIEALFATTVAHAA